MTERMSDDNWNRVNEQFEATNAVTGLYAEALIVECRRARAAEAEARRRLKHTVAHIAGVDVNKILGGDDD